MLEQLGWNGKRIIDAFLSEDHKHCELIEACDSYFSVKLNRKQLMELARDFMGLADQMKED